MAYNTKKEYAMEELYAYTADRALQSILEAAIANKASDIHMEPEEERLRIRFRKDGTLTESFVLPSKMAESLAVRLKVIGHMDVGERRLPQDGSAVFEMNGKSYDLRISLLPSLYGENAVVRVLSGNVDFIEENRLGMLPEQEEIFRKRLFLRNGMILTTGPTGSGKTSTLYSALRLINQPEISIVSVEDPVEYRIVGITQMQVNEKAGLTFARGLRSIVRQDPDVVMIGEIRDRETAEIAIHAALTGHLVLSSLHTNHAAEAPLRLSDMGIPSYLLSAAVTVVIGQRLVRRLCSRCKKEEILTEEGVKEFSLPRDCVGKRVYFPVGCEVCDYTGYAGRTGVFEVWETEQSEKKAIRDNVAPFVLEEMMRAKGTRLMRDVALQYMEEGRISPEDAALAGGGS